MKILSEPIDISAIVTELKSGAVLAYPTETSFGLGCDATNIEAVNKIFQIKERDLNKPMLVVVSDLEMIKPYIIWDERLEKIKTEYWPGPLTVVVSAKPNSALVPGVVSNDNLVAFRVTSHPIASRIVEVLSRPLVSTSANKAGEPALFSSVDIVEKFATGIAPDLVIEGALPKVPASTMIKLEPEGFSVLRQGGINFTL